MHQLRQVSHKALSWVYCFSLYMFCAKKESVQFRNCHAQSRNSHFVAQIGDSYLAQDNSGIVSASIENLNKVRIKRCSACHKCLYLFVCLIWSFLYMFCSLTEKNIWSSGINNNFHDCRLGHWPLLYVNGHSIKSCFVFKLN